MNAHPLILASPAATTTRELAFWILAIIAVAAGLGMVLARRAVHCAVMLAVVMLSLAVLYAMQGAPFLAFVQVIVYTGAVLMLFLFVLMIVGISASDSVVETIRGQRLAAGVFGIGLLVLLSLVVGHAAIGPAAPATAAFGGSNITGIARLIFTKYVFPFEITSALLITAALGAMVLTHRERTTPKPSQRALARKRIAGGHPTPLPGPGTYARHNAVDMPALLPDGSPSDLSVSEALGGIPSLRRPGAGEITGAGEISDAGDSPRDAGDIGPADDGGDSPDDAGDSPGEVTVGGGASPATSAGDQEDAQW
jgi:NADH-quinone oxidoreductase subunit J